MTGQLRQLLAGGVVLLVGLVAGCSAGGDHPEPGPTFEKLRKSGPDQIGASVDEHPIGVSEFQTYWRSKPEHSSDEVIDGVLDREIAVQRALADEIHQDPEMQFVRKKAMVQELLRREVESQVTPEDLDDNLVERLEQQLRRQLGRPRGIRASHLLVMLPKDQRGKGEKDGKLRENARRWIERIRKSLPEDPSVEELFVARRKFADRIAGPLEIVVNAHLSFPSPQSRPFRGELPASWMHVVSAFGEAAERMLSEGRVGEISEPVESKYGWHLVRAEQRLEGRVPEPETLREVAVSRALRLERAKLFSKKLERWRRGMSIAYYPEAVAEAVDERNE